MNFRAPVKTGRNDIIFSNTCAWGWSLFQTNLCCSFFIRPQSRHPRPSPYIILLSPSKFILVWHVRRLNKAPKAEHSLDISEVIGFISVNWTTKAHCHCYHIAKRTENRCHRWSNSDLEPLRSMACEKTTAKTHRTGAIPGAMDLTSRTLQCKKSDRPWIVFRPEDLGFINGDWLIDGLYQTALPLCHPSVCLKARCPKIYWFIIIFPNILFKIAKKKLGDISIYIQPNASLRFSFLLPILILTLIVTAVNQPLDQVLGKLLVTESLLGSFSVDMDTHSSSML